MAGFSFTAFARKKRIPRIPWTFFRFAAVFCSVITNEPILLLPLSTEKNYKKSDKSSLEKVNHWIVRVYDWGSLSALLGFRLFKYWNFHTRALAKSQENPGKYGKNMNALIEHLDLVELFEMVNRWIGEFYGTWAEIAGITWIILESYSIASLFVRDGKLEILRWKANFKEFNRINWMEI